MKKQITMSTITYFVRSSKRGEKEISIWIRIQHNKNDLRLSTGIKIPARFWNHRMGTVKVVPNESNQVKERLKFIDKLIYDVKHRIYLELSTSHFITPRTIRKIIDIIIGENGKSSQYVLGLSAPTLGEYVQFKIVAMVKREFLNKGEPYSQNAIENWRKFLNVWSSFEVANYPNGLYPDDISMHTYYQFMDFCDSNNYKKSTKYQYARLFKAAMNYALADGFSKNRVHLTRNFATHSSMEASKGIYLTMGEIFNLSLLDLPEGSSNAKVRDLFLLGCYTGMRYSDYSSISIEDIIHFDVDGKQYAGLMKRQKKTKQKVAIPLWSDDAEKILHRWGGRAPKVSIALFNRKIKDICKMAGITEKIRVSEIIANKEVHKWTTKDQLVSSHTARRSCITNLYLSGKLDSSQIRDISGHKTEEAFRRYICLNAEENIKSIFKKLVHI